MNNANDGLHLLKKLGSLGIHAIKCPTGVWVLRGSGIPAEALYERKDGAPLTDDDVAAIKHAGPWFAPVRTRTYATQAEALAAVEAG